MGKELSDGLKRLSFMKRTAAPSSVRNEPLKASAPAASQETVPRKDTPAPKVSSKLLQLKFMQRAQQKEDLQQQQEAAAKQKADERFVYEDRLVGGCRVQFDDAPAIVVAAGRLSFQNFNPAVDQAAAELRRRTQLVEAAAAERDASVSDAAMAGALTKRKRGRSDTAVGGDVGAAVAAPAKPVDAALRVKSEGVNFKRVKVEVDDADEGEGCGAVGVSSSGQDRHARGEQSGEVQQGGRKTKKLKTKKKEQGGSQRAGVGLGGVPRDKLLERLKQLKSAAC